MITSLNSGEGDHEATQLKENGAFDDWVMIERMHGDFNHSRGFPWNLVDIL